MIYIILGKFSRSSDLKEFAKFRGDGELIADKAAETCSGFARTHFRISAHRLGNLNLWVKL